MSEPTSFATWLVGQMELRGLTTTQLGVQLRINRHTVQNWIGSNRKPDPVNCQLLADVLNLPVTEVLAAAGYPPEAQ